MHCSDFSKMVHYGSHSASQHVPALLKLQHKYHDRPISLADACIVRMAEIHERHAVFTLRIQFHSLSQIRPRPA